MTFCLPTRRTVRYLCVYITWFLVCHGQEGSLMCILRFETCIFPVLKDKSGVCLINATKQTYQ